MPKKAVGDREKAVKLYREQYLASRIYGFQWNGSLEKCMPGTLPDSIQRKVLQRINYFRAQAGLHPVAFADSLNRIAQAAALMMAKAERLNHYPDKNWPCFTRQGQRAAGGSCLAYNQTHTEAIDGFIADEGKENYLAGHRRWVLYSQAGVFGHGSTLTACALYVMGTRIHDNKTSATEFIAWPNAGYCPAELVYPRWSFGVPGEADFTEAEVTMTDEQGYDIELTLEPYVFSDIIYGDPSIVWVPKLPYLEDSDVDRTFHVQINNVKVGGVEKNYSYSVTVFHP